MIKLSSLYFYFTCARTNIIPEFSLPDQLSANLISGLLKIATKFSQRRDKIFKDICAFLGKLANQLRCGNGILFCFKLFEHFILIQTYH